MAYIGNLRELLENLLEVIREINKLTRWKKMQKKSTIFLLFGNFNGRKSVHSQ